MSDDRYLRAVNKDYARLLRDVRARHKLFQADHLTVDQMVTAARDTGAFTIPTTRGDMTPFQYACYQAIDDAEQFWRERRVPYREAVRKLRCHKIHNTGVAALLYSDTLVLHDPLGIPRNHPVVHKTCLIALPNIISSANQIPLLEANSDLPLAVIDPYDFGEDAPINVYEEMVRGEIDDPVLADAERLTVAFLNRVARVSLKFTTSLEWRRLGDSEDHLIDISKLFHLEAIVHFLRSAHSARDGSESNAALLDAAEGKVGVIEGHTYKQLLRLIFARFYAIAHQEAVATRCGASFATDYPDLYALKLDLDGNDMKRQYHASDDQVAALAFSTPPLATLSLTLDGIIQFRETGGPLVLRELLREYGSQIQTAAPEELPALATSFVCAIRERLDEHADEVEALKSRVASMNEKEKSNALRFASVSGLSLLTAPIPYSALMGVGLSLLVSAPTAVEMINDVRETRRLRENLEALGGRPICIFSSALGPGRPVFRWPWTLG